VINEVFKEFFLKSSRKEFVTKVGEFLEATDDGQDEKEMTVLSADAPIQHSNGGCWALGLAGPSLGGALD
jgi:hypothetical protein